jgi:uncharacterized protein (TIGR00251 family)
MSWFRCEGDALVLQLKVQPGARTDAFGGLHGDRLKLKLRAPALDGRANIALCEFLADAFGTSRMHVRLEQGSLDSFKRVRITAITQIPPALSAIGLRWP